MTYETIGRFQVIRRIGGGGGGEVSLAFDPDHGRQIALKVVHVGIRDPEMLEAEKRGAEIQDQLSREVPQIARIYEKGQIDNKFFIAMEYVPGTDLEDRLRTGPLSPRLALSYAIQLCAILDACSRVRLSGVGHRDRVVHGDIKPQNIRIEDGDRVRLLDFGVAKSVSMTRPFTENIFGSIPYLSPERLAENHVNVQSDLWAVGVVLYRMLTGRLPYEGESDEIMVKIRRGGLPQPPSPRLSPEMRQILARCLEQSPNGRYRDAASLKEALERVEEVEVPTAVERGGEPTQRTWPSPPETEPEEAPRVVPPAPRGRLSFWKRWWARLSREARSDLQQAQEQLRRLRGAVPSRAHNFRNATAGLVGEMERTSRQLWIRRDEVDGYRQRVASFDQIAEPLAAAIREVEQVEREIQDLHHSLEGQSDARTRDWFEQQIRSWTADLQKVGGNVQRLAELQDQRDEVRQIRETVRFYAPVLEKLDEAERTLARLGESVQTEALARELPALQEQLVREGASEDWLERLQTLVLPLREIAKQARDPLELRRKVPLLLTELRAWPQPPAELTQEVERIEQRLRSLGPGARLAEIEALVSDSDDLRERFLQHTQEQRDTLWTGLDQEAKLLASMAGPQPLLEENLRGLRRREVELPQEHSDWMGQLEKVRELFRTTAKNQEGLLAQGLSARLDRIRERLLGLRGLPLSADTLRELENLEDEIHGLAQPGGGGQPLIRFRRTGEIETRIEQLHLQTTDDLRELTRRKGLLAEHNAELQTEARLVGIELADLSQRIDQIGTGSSLEASHSSTDELSADLDGLRRRFEEQCRKILGERLSEIQVISEALQRIDRSFPPPVLSALASGASPREVALAVAAGLDLVRLAQEAAAQAFQSQEEVLQGMRSVLGRDHSAVLGPDEHRPAAALLAEIDRELAGGPADPVGRLERRKTLIEACEPLINRLQQDEWSARERIEALHRRLEKPEVDLRTFCPELTERIADLVYGIPANPRQWKVVQDQLAEAETQLSRVETHARRLAAEELHRAARDLWPGDGDPDDTLWGQLSRAPRETLPPLSLRRKVLEAHARQQQKGRRNRA